MSITYKDEAGIQGMKTACRLAAEVLDFLTPHIKPGITTKEIDRLASECMKTQGSISATLHSPGTRLNCRIRHSLFPTVLPPNGARTVAREQGSRASPIRVLSAT